MRPRSPRRPPLSKFGLWRNPWLRWPGNEFAVRGHLAPCPKRNSPFHRRSLLLWRLNNGAIVVDHHQSDKRLLATEIGDYVIATRARRPLGKQLNGAPRARIHVDRPSDCIQKLVFRVFVGLSDIGRVVGAGDSHWARVIKSSRHANQANRTLRIPRNAVHLAAG